MKKPRLLIISDVLPFPGASGQQQRVALKLKALRPYFHLHFLTVVAVKNVTIIREKLLAYVDEVTLIESLYIGKSLPERAFWRALGFLDNLQTGLKFSNFRMALDYSQAKMPAADMVLFEYFHAHQLTSQIRKQGIPTVLDMHDILWKSYERQMEHWPRFWRERQVKLYKDYEEKAWQNFDAVIAINLGEKAYVEQHHPQVLYAPMGIDVADWPYCYQPTEPPRIAYYGGLGSAHNQADARFCYEVLMPRIWQVYPDAELWLVGSNPSPSLQNLADVRVHVTGYVADVQNILKTMTLVLCPFTGQYGFRSRLIEVLALGVPVIASPDAVYGMGLETVFLAETADEMVESSLKLLGDKMLRQQSSQAAHAEIEAKFTFESSYAKLADELLRLLKSQKHV